MVFKRDELSRRDNEFSAVARMAGGKPPYERCPRGCSRNMWIKCVSDRIEPHSAGLSSREVVREGLGVFLDERIGDIALLTFAER
jgi:hypothetical protein